MKCKATSIDSNNNSFYIGKGEIICHLVAAEEDSVTEEVLADLEKCTKPLALTAERKQKFLSSLSRAVLFTAEIAIRSTRNSKITRSS